MAKVYVKRPDGREYEYDYKQVKLLLTPTTYNHVKEWKREIEENEGKRFSWPALLVFLMSDYVKSKQLASV